MTGRVAEAISFSGAWLVGFSMFSNVSATVRVGLAARQVDSFGRCLHATGLVLDDDSRRAITGWSAESDDEVVATLRIAFLADAAEPEAA